MRRYLYISKDSHRFYWVVSVLSFIGTLFLFLVIASVESEIDQKKWDIRPLEIQTFKLNHNYLAINHDHNPKNKKNTHLPLNQNISENKLDIFQFKKDELNPLSPNIETNVNLTLDIEFPQMNNNFVFQIYEVQQSPIPIHRIEPIYPYLAKNKGIEGYVTLEFVVDTYGNVLADTTKIIDSQPKSIFDQASLQSIKKWKFRPGTFDGKPVAVNVSQTMVFELQ